MAGLLESLFSSILSDAAASLIGDMINLGRDRAAEVAKAQLAQFSAILDDVTCELCEDLDGSIFQVGSPEYETFMPRIHHNCRCIYVYIDPEEEDPPAVTRVQIDDDEIKKHGTLIKKININDYDEFDGF
jgi:SPP1 gp7 family putative phage head morphogenesis protein